MSIFQSLQHYFIYKVIIVTIDDEGVIKVFQYKTTKNETLKLSVIPNYCGKSNIKANDIFLRMKPKEITELNVGYIIDEIFVQNTKKGLHIEIINEIADNLNLKLNYILSENENAGFLYENGTAYGMILELKAKKFDFIVSPYIRFSYESYYLEPTEMIIGDSIKYIIGKTIITNNWKMFYGSFSVTVWILYLVIAVIAGLLHYLIRKLTFQHYNFSIIMSIVRIMLEGPALIKFNSFSSKVLFIHFIFYCVVISTIYKSKLYYFMNTDQSYQSINTLNDVMKNGIRICLARHSITFLEKSEHPFAKYVLTNNPQIEEDLNICWNQTAFRKDKVSEINTMLLKVLIERFIDSEGRSLVHILKRDQQHSFFFNMYFAKGHPLIDIFNKKILILKQIGFMNKLYNGIDRAYKKSKALTAISKSLQAKSLTITTLKSTFCIYFICIILSIIVFILEFTHII
ncbi:unnamed protein product [Psylliodes chrysocephalus]|uniref:Ionotropic glutamate receptor C-terminal domain-containing protein n=1 Tax=Psylliodes chrysocephalus TaxID=3402493 RepID=A0A9P0D6R6_9CUCU|nr:unnamed protein product [Psylliodes chrysocephala]